MKKKINWINVTAIIILFVNLLFIAYISATVKVDNTALFNKEIYSFNNNWVITDKNGSILEKVSLPYIGLGEYGSKQTEDSEKDFDEADESDVIFFENKIPEKYWGLTLTFSSIEVRFRVLIDGRIVYEKNDKKVERFIKRGNTTYFINIPSDLIEGKIQIELFSGHRIRIENMEIAKRDTVILSWILKNLFNIVCSLIMLVGCVTLFFLTAIRKHSKQSTEGMLYLGFFCLDASVYYALSTQTLSVFIGNETILNLIMYVCLMLMPYFFIVYYGQNITQSFRQHYIILWKIITINIFLQIFFYFFEILKLSRLEIIIHLILAATIAMTIKILNTISKMEYRIKVNFEMAGLYFLILGEIIDLICTYVLSVGNSGQFGRYGMTLFCVIMTFINVEKVSKGYSESIAENQRLLQSQVEYMKLQNEKLTEAKEDAETARKEAIAANETKSRFLANMSHEIRTPINAVLGMDEMILRESAEPDIKKYAMDIQTAGQSLLSLINDILDFSKIDSGKMEIIPAKYDFSSMINDVANMINLKAKAKNLEMKTYVSQNLPSELYGDDIRIRQVLVNILTNAVKYTEEGGVSLIISGNCCGDRVKLHFEVRDTGIGIKEEDISKLFVKFERIEEKRNRSIEGTGLGLNITANLLKLMNSELKVESKYGAGSRFFFDIEQKIINYEPIGNLEERIRKMSEEYSYDASFTAPEAKILIVDDNLINCRVFKSLLKETKIHIDEANSGKECIEKASANAYDLIFLDHMMPEMDGIETLHHLRNMGDYPSKSAKITALTANAISGAKEMYLKEGFDAFLSKPILSDNLEHLICRLLPKELIIYGYSQNEAAGIEKTEDTIEIPDIEGLDIDYGLLHLSDKKLLLETIRDFYVTLESQAEILSGNYKKGDIEAYRIQVHGMKSTSALIGAVPLAGTAKILEYAAKDGRKDIIDKLNDVFLEEWLGYKEKLSVLFEKDEKQKTEDSSLALAYLEMLSSAMEDMDIDKADEICENLSRLSYNDEIDENMNKLAADVANLDSESAKGHISILTKLLNDF